MNYFFTKRPRKEYFNELRNSVDIHLTVFAKTCPPGFRLGVILLARVVVRSLLAIGTDLASTAGMFLRIRSDLGGK